MRRTRPYPLVSRVGELQDRVRGRRVLHLGCTNWPYTAESIAAGTFLHADLAAAVGPSGELWGIDGDGDGLDALRHLGYERLLLGDLEHLADVSFGAPFDVVIAGEIIEHLGNPAGFLRGVRAVLGPDGELVVTTVNAYCAFRFAQYAIRGRGGRAEPVHPDHVAYYSRSTLSHLLDREGWDVVGFSFYDLGAEHRPTLRSSLRLVNDVAVRLAPQLADGVIAVCRPR